MDWDMITVARNYAGRRSQIVKTLGGCATGASCGIRYSDCSGRFNRC
jgi:hypothetical protein